MPTHLVNLDALICREDFESGSTASLGNEPIFKIEELAQGRLYFSVLRKPEFQRETANWKPETIVDFVESYLDGKLIPSIIMWHSQKTGKVFIIDGAHRMSALIAWVNDDYGDGIISRKFFGVENIPAEQKRLHEKTKRLMETRIGPYQSVYQAALHGTGDEKTVFRGRAIATRQFHIQKVEGDAKVAEDSFFRINSSPVTIDPTELDVIQARRKPNAIATRAIIRAGTGYEYWGSLPRATEIKKAAKEVYDLIFGSVAKLGPKSSDVPRAGEPYSATAFKMILDVVNIFNNVTPAMWQSHRDGQRKKGTPLADDVDGSVTLSYLDRLRRIGQLVADSSYSGSLGLDPAVYSYGVTGFNSAALIASLRFAVELRERKLIGKFCGSNGIRKDFEEFLVAHKKYVNELGHSKGGRTRPVDSLLRMHWIVFDCLIAGRSSHAEINQELAREEQLKAIRAIQEVEDEQEEQEESDSASGGTDAESVPRKKRKFSQRVQLAGVIRDILAQRTRCEICGARIPPDTRSRDHIDPRFAGGSSQLDNLRHTHPCCNSSRQYDEAAD